MANYLDKYGAPHNVQDPSPTATENPPLYFGILICLKYALGELTIRDCYKFVNYVNQLHHLKFEGLKNAILRLLGWNWHVTPESTRYDFSKDNWIGVALGLRCVMKYCQKEGFDNISGLKRAMGSVRLFHPQLIHPVAWCTVAWAKYQWNWCLPVIKYGNKISCEQTHKIRGKRVIAKTDGKIMAFITWLTADYSFNYTMLTRELIRPYPLPDNNKDVVKYTTYKGKKVRAWKWWSWRNIFLDYFEMKSDHPIVFLATKYEDEILNKFHARIHIPGTKIIS